MGKGKEGMGKGKRGRGKGITGRGMAKMRMEKGQE